LIAEALGLKPKRAALPPLPSGATPAAVMPPRPPLTSDPPRTIARPVGDDQPLAPQQATTAGFAPRVSQSPPGEPPSFAGRSAGQVPPLPNAQASSPLASLFTSSNDFVRAFVMQEILQPPRSLRPHARAFAPASATRTASAPPAEPAD